MNKAVLQSRIHKSKLNRSLKDKALVGETPLCKLAYKYGADKCPRLKHNYTPYYYSLLKKRRKTVKMVFEMGIGYYRNVDKLDKVYDPGLKRWYVKGASLKMWRDFFPKAKVVGADIRPETMFIDKRIETHICDQTKPVQVRKLLNKIGKKIDIFIDDASHRPETQVLLAKTALPFLKRNVVYIIEDVRNYIYITDELNDYYPEVIICNKKVKDDCLVIVKNVKKQKRA